MVHTRSIWSPAISDLFLSMRYGVSSRGRYGRYRDDPDGLGLIRIEAGRGSGASGAPGKGRALMRKPDLDAPRESHVKAGVFDTLEPRENGGAGRSGNLHSGSEWSMSDEDSPRGQHGAPVEGATAAEAVTFVATFPHGAHAAAGPSENSSVADAGTLARPK